MFLRFDIVIYNMLIIHNFILWGLILSNNVENLIIIFDKFCIVFTVRFGDFIIFKAGEFY